MEVLTLVSTTGGVDCLEVLLSALREQLLPELRRENLRSFTNVLGLVGVLGVY